MRTIIEKLWDSHVVHEQAGAPALLFIDLHLVHEVTSPQAFQGLRERGLKVRRPDLTVATVDHSLPTTDPSLPIIDQIAARQLDQLAINCGEFAIRYTVRGVAIRASCMSSVRNSDSPSPA